MPREAAMQMRAGILALAVHTRLPGLKEASGVLGADAGFPAAITVAVLLRSFT